MPNKKVLIEVTKDEEITALVDRIIHTEESDLVLSIPEEARSLKNILDFKLLKREVDMLGKRVAIYSPDSSLESLAKKVGFEVSGKASINKPIRKVMDIVHPEEVPKISIEELFEKDMSPFPQEGEHEIKINTAPPESSRSKKRFSEEPREPVALLPDTEAFLREENHANLPGTELVNNKTVGDDPSYISEQFWKERRYESELDTLKSKPRIEKEAIFNEMFAKSDGHAAASAQQKKATRRMSGYKKFVLAVGGLVVILVPILLYAFRGIEVVITPHTATLTIDFPLKAGSSFAAVDAAKGTVPGQIIQVEQTVSRKFSGTGEKDVLEKARGTIVIYNAYSSQSQLLRVETRFASSNGKIFKLTKGVTVPGAKIVDGTIVPSKVAVEAVADLPGAEYNITAGRFTIPGFSGTPKFDKFYGISEKPMQGGAKGRVNIVTAEDVKNAKTALEDAFKKDARTELEGKLPTNLTFIESSYREEILESAADPGAGAIADLFTYRVKGIVRALMINGDDTLTVAAENLKKELDAHEVAVPSSQQVTYMTNAVNWNNGIVDVKVTYAVDYYADIKEEDIKQGVVGKEERDIFDYLLKNKAVGEAKVKFWPFWLKSAPGDLGKIKTTVIRPQ